MKKSALYLRGFYPYIGGFKMNLTLIVIATAAVLFEIILAPLFINNMRNRRNMRGK
jgi:hypothetical protein